MEDEPAVLRTLQDDGAYSRFLSADFDVNREASTLLQSAALSEQLAHITKGIALLDSEIADQVNEHYEDLLSQASGTGTLDDVLQTMLAKIQALLAAVERLRSRVEEPYLKIASQSVMLSRLHAACDMLRRLIRLQQLSRRLQAQLRGGLRDITKAAKTLSELDETVSDVDLTGLEVYEREQRQIRAGRQSVEKQAAGLLQRGMESLNQSQVATALQVCHSLGSLQPTVDGLLTDTRDRLQTRLTDALRLESVLAASSGPGTAAGRPGAAALPSNTVTFRAALWNNLERLADHIYGACAQIQHIHKVLSKKRDPVTQVCFIDEVRSAQLMPLFWQDVTAMIRTEFVKAAERQTFIRQAFEGEYPKLVRLHQDLWTRLQQFATPPAADGQPQFNPESSLREALAPFERAYLSRSLSRLFDPVNLMFSAETVPAREEIDAVVRTVANELTVSGVDPSLCLLVARNVAKTVQLFCVKCEQLLVTDGDASQVIGPMSPGQTTNVQLVNVLQTFEAQLRRLLAGQPTLAAEARDAVLASLEGVGSLMRSGIQPLVTSIAEAIEAIILTMHNEDFSGEEESSGGESNCSLYMKELQTFISRAVDDYLAPFNCKPLITASKLELGRRAVELFVRHAALVRPVGAAGRLRLAADCAQLELAVAPLCERLASLGTEYRVLRAFKPLLFQTPEHMAQSPALGEVLPYSLVVHLLFARGPPELRSPHHTASWSVSRYSAWLDEHRAERERLQLLTGALDAHVQAVRAQGGTSFADVYPVMLELLQRGTAALAASDR
ncbi:conserved oligomeric Golgi complex subunit 5-like isoform X1 [Amphibalanus amphitrite]|nr:conserved oligomeric Golgi complex subunit 5-like isoform X1 [Amphibalanus amphitrite]